ncbi:cytochrome c biogenesis CcdA family protein [Cohnella phaseoli]|uniref:Cytochrome c-type biogenesis protein n=1 Tax=Cohnella phaseoli TaxID=456490 RepID=A0A3D9JRA9_9BACL|nr:cytochrome c biogenesis protein CcdA [Cohnella phaseoli]RED76087.1 cytochrome c-type biogenesis protein [Cohnella phaseoli]
MENAADLTFWFVFGVGILSFLSPCCLPLYPSYLSYLTGISAKELQEGKKSIRQTVIPHALFFIVGFSVIFYSLGFSASFIGRIFAERQELIRQLGAILIVISCLMMLGIFKPSLLLKEKRWIVQQKAGSHVGSFFVGMTYAAGWTPCVGPILAAVLALGVTEPSKALWYTTIYTIGFAIPFILMAFAVVKIKWLTKHGGRLMKIGGAITVVTGVLLYTDQLSLISRKLIGLYGGFIGF